MFMFSFLFGAFELILVRFLKARVMEPCMPGASARDMR